MPQRPARSRRSPERDEPREHEIAFEDLERAYEIEPGSRSPSRRRSSGASVPPQEPHDRDRGLRGPRRRSTRCTSRRATCWRPRRRSAADKPYAPAVARPWNAPAAPASGGSCCGRSRTSSRSGRGTACCRSRRCSSATRSATCRGGPVSRSCGSATASCSSPRTSWACWRPSGTRPRTPTRTGRSSSPAQQQGAHALQRTGGQPQPARTSEAEALMDALRRSVEEAKRGAPRRGAPRPSDPAELGHSASPSHPTSAPLMGSR